MRTYSIWQFGNRVNRAERTLLGWIRRGILPDRRDAEGKRFLLDEDLPAAYAYLRSLPPPGPAWRGWSFKDRP
jgi:hypothetical protein